MPQITIVIPSYNNFDSLRKTLTSLEQQDTKLDFKVVVVDNGSAPPLPSLNGDYTFLLEQTVCLTPGSYAARNQGAQLASSEIIAFLDSDCTAYPDWLEQGWSALQEKEIVGGDVEFLPASSNTLVERYQCYSGFQQKENVIQRGFSATANLFVTRHAFNIVGNFNEDLLSGGDREWCWRATSMGFTINYNPLIRVTTPARSNLSQIIRQTRRVAGGKLQLESIEFDKVVPPSGLVPHQPAITTLVNVLRDPSISYQYRIGFILLAAMLRGISMIERLRIKLGNSPERL